MSQICFTGVVLTSRCYSDKKQKWHKCQYDREIECTKLQIGDKVLHRHTAFGGEHKIQDQWENTIFQVVGKPFEVKPVFKVKAIKGDSKTQVIHCNLLLPLYNDYDDLQSSKDIYSEDKQVDK